jgi:trehalose 6-phosphate phosphatase
MDIKITSRRFIYYLSYSTRKRKNLFGSGYARLGDEYLFLKAEYAIVCYTKCENDNNLTAIYFFSERLRKVNLNRNNPPLISPANLAEKVAGHKEVLLMMDYDGTLVSIMPRPDLARPDKELLKILEQLCRLPKYTLAVLSGRRPEELRELLPVPGLYLGGVHGAVIISPDGDFIPLQARTGVEKIITTLCKLADECIKNQPGFLIENKRYALAIHYRLAGFEPAEKVLESFIKESKRLRRQFDLELLKGKKILEVRPKGLHKGNAVSWLKKNLPQAFFVFLGDDTTDEDAFKCIENGLGVLVSEHLRPSNASLRLKSPLEVQKFLELLA